MGLHSEPVGLDSGPVGLDLGPVSLDLGPVGLDLGPVGLDLGPVGLGLGPMVPAIPCYPMLGFHSICEIGMVVTTSRKSASLALISHMQV